MCVTAGLAGELQTLSGKTHHGELVSLSDKEIVFRATSGQVTAPVADALLLDLQRDQPLPSGLKYTEVELTDGTVLHAVKVAIKGKDVELTLAVSNIKAKVPLAAIVSLLNDAQDAAVKQEWQTRCVAKKGNQDILALKVNGVLNALEGTLGEVGTDKGEIAFEFELGGARKKRNVDPAKAQGMLFLRTLSADAPSPVCKLFDLHQNVIVVGKLALKATGFAVTSVSGATVEYPRTTVARLDYSNDKVVFLSDMKPAELVEKSRQGRKETLRNNKNLDNGTIQVEDQVFSKGLAVHSHTEVTYNLDGKYQKLEAVLGMDAMVGGDGRPVVRIETDGKEVFAATITRKDRRKELNIPVKGAKQLRIVVTSSGLFDFGDHVDFANAKLSK
jgi:hypothetical protein